MTPEELNAAKFALDQRRLRFERAKAKREQSFLFRNSSVLISGALSLAAIAVSVTSAINSIQATKQNYDLQLQETLRKGKAEEEATKRASAETDRKASFDLLQYITANYDLVFSQKSEKQIRVRNAMEPAFPKTALDRTFAQLAETAPTKDGPNVWQEAQRKSDVLGVTGEPPQPPVGGGSPPVPSTREELIKALTGPHRRLEADRLAKLPPGQIEPAISLLISTLLPQTDRWSYRFNLYAVFALAKAPGGWRGSKEQLASVTALTRSGNYNDKTFKTWVDAAIKNYRGTGA